MRLADGAWELIASTDNFEELIREKLGDEARDYLRDKYLRSAREERDMYKGDYLFVSDVLEDLVREVREASEKLRLLAKELDPNHALKVAEILEQLNDERHKYF